jgi:hypothetical protein
MALGGMLGPQWFGKSLSVIRRLCVNKAKLSKAGRTMWRLYSIIGETMFSNE